MGLLLLKYSDKGLGDLGTKGKETELVIVTQHTTAHNEL